MESFMNPEEEARLRAVSSEVADLLPQLQEGTRERFSELILRLIASGNHAALPNIANIIRREVSAHQILPRDLTPADQDVTPEKPGYIAPHSTRYKAAPIAS
jgi:hypothetical protein